MVKIFLTGATGYVGGQALHSIASALPADGNIITCLVRDGKKAELVQKSQPDHVRTVVGDLDNTDLIERESADADIVLHLASTNHASSARAIANALNKKSQSQPSYWIQISGGSLFVASEIKEAKYGEATTKVYDDENDKDDILSTIRGNPARFVDNLIVSQDPTKIRTALIVGPLIYGTGAGPLNQKSIQAPQIAKKTITDGRAFQLGKGLNRWSNIHIEDLGNLILKLTRAAIDQKAEGWNEDGIFLPAQGDLEFGALCQEIANEARKQHLIKDDNPPRVIDTAEANEAMPHGAVLWGTNAVYKSSRATRLLDWTPKAPSLKDTLAEVVRVEAALLKQ